jgi:uncharacterized repeat protein (TIGR03803 family)
MKILRIPLVVVLVAAAGRAFNANAQTETNLHSFVGSPYDGYEPFAGLVQGSDGNFYGTTLEGGTSGSGTVFRVSPSGSETNLHSFTGSQTDGGYPWAGLVQGSDGSFYGTTFGGGTHGKGTIFRISPSGSYTNLYSFIGYPTDGYEPQGGLVQGSDGYFYGTTDYGGTNYCNCGTVFRISASGSYTNLYSFAGPPTDASVPHAGLVQGSDGNFYGTTAYGGTNTSCWGGAGCGTVFRISPSGTKTDLYSFGSSPTDGYQPLAGLVQGSDSYFYGTTVNGGTVNSGTVFRISPSGTYTNLYSFGSSSTDGNTPYAGLVQGSDGNFYGTTQAGGTTRQGTVFRISPSGSYLNLFSFYTYSNDGYGPEAGLVQGSDGSFYGTTAYGGTSNSGIVYRLTVPLSPPPYTINQITGVHVAGMNLVFNVVSIAGETYQLQFSSSMNTTNWVNVPGVSVTNSIGALLTLTNFAGASQPQGFYRFAITP